MPVPEFYYFIRPALEVHADGEIHDMHEVRKIVQGKLDLTESDLEELVVSGNTTKVYDRTRWALTYLRAARLLDLIKRGQNRITERGKEYLKNAPTVIKPSNLMAFEEFAKFTKTNRKISTLDSIDLQPTLTDDLTPIDAMSEAADRLRSELTREILDMVKQASPRFFESLIVQLMLKLGYGGPDHDAGQVVGKTGDGGVDGVINEDRLGLGTIYLQAKRYGTNTVGSGEVQAFAGALMGHGAKKGVFITTSTFSQAAVKYVDGLKEYSIKLIDGSTLAKLMFDYNLGVVVQHQFEVKRIDSDFYMED